MSWSVMRLMCPLRTCLSHICSGLLPILYRIDRNPDWNVFLNIPALAAPPRALLRRCFSENCPKPFEPNGFRFASEFVDLAGA